MATVNAGETSDLDKLARRLSETYRALAQSRLLCSIGLAAVRDYPKNVPEEIRAIFKAGTKSLRRALADAGLPAPESDKALVLSADEASLAESTVFHDFLTSTEWGNSDTDRSTAFERMILEQSFLVSFAVLDAFFADALRIACIAQPLMMSSEKQIAWSEVLGVGSWDGLLTKLADAYIFEIGVKPLKARVAWLRKRHKFAIPVSPAIEDYLARAEAVRNVIVHAGSTATAEFLRVTPTSTLKLNDRVELTKKHCSQTSNAIGRFCAALALEIGTKVLRVDEREAQWRFGLGLDHSASTAHTSAEKASTEPEWIWNEKLE